MDHYVDRKTHFIIAVLEKAGFDQILLNDISGQNRIDKPNN